MPVSDNSATAHRDHVLSGQARSQRDRILALLHATDHPMSRRAIAHYFSFPTQDGGPVIELSSVCGRINSLLADPDKGRPGLVRVAYVRSNTRGHPVDFLEAIPLAEADQIPMLPGFAPRREVA